MTVEVTSLVWGSDDLDVYVGQLLKPALTELVKTLLISRPPDPWAFIAQYSTQKNHSTLALPPISQISSSCSALATPEAHLTPTRLSSTASGISRAAGRPLNTSRSGDTEDCVRRVHIPAPQQARRPCGSCYNLRRECHLLKLKYLALSYDMYQIAKLPVWQLDQAIGKSRRRAINATKEIVVVARQNMQTAARTFAVQLVTRGADSTSTSRSTDSANTSDIDALPDILKTQDFHWRAQHRISVSAEATSLTTALQTPLPMYHKTDAEKRRVEACVEKSVLFRCIMSSHRAKLIDCLKPVRVPAGTNVVRQGDSGDGMYFIDEGTLSVDRITKGETKHLRVVGPGDSFGEVALLYYSDRSASVTAVSDCRLWFLQRDAFNVLVRQSAFQKRERFEQFLKKVPLLQTLGLYARGQLIDACDEMDLPEHSILYEMGETKADAFYIIVEGQALVETTEGSRVLSSTEFFGEGSLMNDAPRHETVSAYGGSLKLLSISRKAWKKIVGEPVSKILEKSLNVS